MTPTVAVVDATAFIRIAVRAALDEADINVVWEASSATEALEMTVSSPPDVLLIGGELDPDMDTVSQMVAAAPEMAVIVLSPDDSAARAMTAVRAGALGFIPKETHPERLPAIVRGAFAGEAAIPRRLVRQLLAEVRRTDAWRSRARTTGTGLSARECEVLALQSEGFGDRTIAERLAISQVTVRRHSASAVRKLGAPHREAALAMLEDASSGPADAPRRAA